MQAWKGSRRGSMIDLVNRSCSGCKNLHHTHHTSHVKLRNYNCQALRASCRYCAACIAFFLVKWVSRPAVKMAVDRLIDNTGRSLASADDATDWTLIWGNLNRWNQLVTDLCLHFLHTLQAQSFCRCGYQSSPVTRVH